MTKLVDELAMKCDVAFKLKKSLIVKAAMALANKEFSNGTTGDGIIQFGDYQGVEFVGDTKDLPKFKGDFIPTACQRTFSNGGIVTITVRDDRPGKHAEKLLLYNSDYDVTQLLQYLIDNCKIEIKDEFDAFKQAVKEAYKIKKVAITKLAMKVANYKTDRGVIGDNMFIFGDYEDDVYTGSIEKLFRFKSDFVVTACQRVANAEGMATLVIRDDRQGKGHQRQLLNHGDKEIINFIKYMEYLMDISL